MAAPATAELLSERLFALGAEVAELRDACYAPPPAASAMTAAQKAYYERAYQALKRFHRDAFGSTDTGRGVNSLPAVAGATYSARNETETAAYIVAAFYSGQDETELTTSLTAVIEAAGHDAAIEVEAVDA